MSDFISRLGENFEVVMDNYLEEFKIKMQNRMRIPKSVVNKYYDEVCFIRGTNFWYAHAILPRVAWLRPIPYEVNIDDVTTIVTTLLSK